MERAAGDWAWLVGDCDDFWRWFTHTHAGAQRLTPQIVERNENTHTHRASDFDDKSDLDQLLLLPHPIQFIPSGNLFLEISIFFYMSGWDEMIPAISAFLFLAFVILFNFCEFVQFFENQGFS